MCKRLFYSFIWLSLLSDDQIISPCCSQTKSTLFFLEVFPKLVHNDSQDNFPLICRTFEFSSSCRFSVFPLFRPSRSAPDSRKFPSSLFQKGQYFPVHSRRKYCQQFHNQSFLKVLFSVKKALSKRFQSYIPDSDPHIF